MVPQPADQTPQAKRTFLKGSLLKYSGLAALVALETPLHEGMHCAVGAVTGSCKGLEFSPRHWYLKPLDYLLGGFLDVKELPAGTDGRTLVQHSDTLWGNLGSIASSAAPEYVYTTIGMVLVRNGVEKWRERPLEGLAQTVAGGMCMSSTLEYMRLSMFGAQPGHDYYNITQKVLEILHLPAGMAGALTPLIGIPLLLGAAYFTAGLLTDLAGRKKAVKVSNV